MSLIRATKQEWFKFQALLLMITFSTTDLCAFAHLNNPSFPYPIAAVVSPHNVVVPFEMGIVQDSFQGNSGSLIIHLQDAHENLSAQKSLAKLVEFIHKSYGVKLLFLEGGEGQLSMKEAREFPSAEARERISRSFLERFELTGPEYYVISANPKMTVYGMERLASYYSNRNDYLLAKRLSEKLSPLLRRLRVSINNIEREVYNPTLRKFIRSQAFSELNPSFLLQHSLFMKEIYDRRKRSNDAELTAAFPTVSKLISGNQSETLNAELLTEELERLTVAVKECLLVSEREKAVSWLSEEISTLNKLFTLGLTPMEYEGLAGRVSELATDSIRAKFEEIGYAKYWSDNYRKLLENLESFIAFYEGALRRDREMAEKLESTLRNEKQKIAVAVTGGFHTAGLTSALREKGDSYVVIQPNVEHLSSREREHYSFVADQELKRLVSKSTIVELEPIAGYGSAERYNRLLHAMEVEQASVDRQKKKLSESIFRGKESEREHAPVQNRGFGKSPAIKRAVAAAIVASVLGLSSISIAQQNRSTMEPRKQGFSVPTAEEVETYIYIYTTQLQDVKLRELHRIEAARQLAKFHDPRVVRVLIETLEDKDTFVQRAVAEALAEIGDSAAIEPLIGALRDKNEESDFRIVVAYSLGKIAGPRVIQPLIDALKDEIPSIRGAAAYSLGKIGDQRAVEALINALKDENLMVRRNSAEALGKIPDPRAIIPLREAMENSSEELPGFHKIAEGSLLTIIETLGERRDRRAVDPLIRTLHTGHYWVHKSTLKALGKIGDPRAVKPLAKVLTNIDPNYHPWIFSGAADALVEIGTAPDSLIDLLKDENPKMRESAASLLGRIGDPRAVESLIEAMKEERLNKDFFKAAVEALGAINYTGNSKLRGKAVTRLVISMGWPWVDHATDIQQAAERSYEKIKGNFSWIKKMYLMPRGIIFWPASLITALLIGLGITKVLIRFFLSSIKRTAVANKSVRLLQIYWKLALKTYLLGLQSNNPLISYIEGFGKIGNSDAFHELLSMSEESFRSSVTLPALSQISSLLELHHDWATDENFKLLINWLSYPWSRVFDYTLGSKDSFMLLLGLLNRFRDLDSGLFTQDNIGLLVKTSDFSTSLAVLDYFGDLIPASIAFEKLATFPSKEISEVDKRKALAQIGAILDKHHELVTESNLRTAISWFKEPALKPEVFAVIDRFASVNKTAFTDENLRSLLSVGDFSLTLEILGKYASLFPVSLLESRNLRELAQEIESQTKRLAESDQNAFRTKVIQSIDKYRSKFINESNAAEEYGEIRVLFEIVGERVPLVLDGLREIGISIGQFWTSEDNFGTFARYIPKFSNKEIVFAMVYWFKAVKPEGLGNENLRLLLSSASFPLVLEILSRFSDLFPDTFVESRNLKRLAEQIEREVALHPQEQQSAFRGRLIQSIDSYHRKFINEGNAAAEYEEIRSWLGIVHDNLPLVLGAFVAIGKSATEFSELRRVLPLNNALTRIVRMLGERTDIIGGYKDVTEKVIKAGSFDRLYGLILEIARDRRGAAPQEISGMLEVLRQTDVSKWGGAEWNSLRRNIHDYYAQGFKSITLNLFNHFVANRNNPEVLATMKSDIEHELQNVAWGGFMGLSDEFKKKYGMSTEDEMALLRRYMSVHALTLRDYQAKYEEIKRALRERGDSWKREIGEELRTLFRLGGSKTATVYQPEEKDRIDREALHQKFVKYLEKWGTDDTKDSKQYMLRAIKDYVSHPEDGKAREALKSAVIIFAIDSGHHDPEVLFNAPEEDEKQRQWVSTWRVHFMDSVRHDAQPIISEIVRTEVGKLKDRDLKRLLGTNQIPDFRSIADRDRFFKEESDMVSLLADNRTAQSEKETGLARIFIDKWIRQIQMDDLLSERVFGAWAERGVKKFSARVLRKVRERNPRAEVTGVQIEAITRSALERARRDFLETERKRSDEDRKKLLLADKITRSITELFNEDVSQIDKELRGYETVEVKTQDSLFIGFFDDLLHLMGFMMTCVCTWGERDKQVKDNRYHFGKIALKTTDGKILGLSQVQLVRAGIQGHPHKESSQGWRVLALPGINLDRGDIGITSERAILALLETAQRLAEMAGLQGAVIPVSPGINSNNHNGEHQAFSQLVAKGWLKTERLSEEIVLSSGYKYDEIYLVQIPKGNFSLTPTSLETRIQDERQQAEQIEKEQSLVFGDGLGTIVVPRGTAKTLGRLVKQNVDRILSQFPKAVLENIQVHAAHRNVSFKIRVDSNSVQSYVNKTDGEIELVAGQDILFEEGKIDTIYLSEMLAELFTAFILDHYYDLKEWAKANENAYFKIQNIKALFNYQTYLARYHKVINKYAWQQARKHFEDHPEEQEALFTRYKADLDKFTKGVKNISQWNLFLNVMDDADPDFMVMNYIHILAKSGKLTDEAVLKLITDVSQVNVGDKTSFSALRNVYKDFILPGRIRLKIADQVQVKDRFTHFDISEGAAATKEALITERRQNEFYVAFRNLFATLFPMTEDELNKEMAQIIESNPFREEDREEVVRNILEEILIRRIGRKAYEILWEHFTGQRGFKVIPYFSINRKDLPQGADADEYGFLSYAGKDEVNYELVFESGGREEEEAAVETPKDWVHDLFPLLKEEGSSSGGIGFGSQITVQALELEQRKVLFVRGSEHLHLIKEAASLRGFRFALPRDLRVVLLDEEARDENLTLAKQTARAIGKVLRLKREQVWIGSRLNTRVEAWLLSGQVIYVGPKGLDPRFEDRLIPENEAWNAFFSMLVETSRLINQSA